MIFSKPLSLVVAVVSIFSLVPSQASAIVGGNLKEGDTSPYVSLSIVTPGDLRAPEWSFCSGTLIGNRWVVTAAHCFWDNKHDMLRFDDNTVVVVSDASGARTPYPIANITPHPLYSKRTYDYDLAIVETRLPVVGASFMPYGGLSASALKGSDTFATGWGMSSVSSSSESPASVKSVQVGIDYLYKNSIVSKHHEGKGSVCYGDSGGSLTATDPRFPESLLIGVLSSMVADYAPATSGDLCNLRNSFISTNLGHLSQWIQSVSSVPPATLRPTTLENFGVGSVSKEVIKKPIRKTICKPAWVSSKEVKFAAFLQAAHATGSLPAAPGSSASDYYPDALIPVVLGGEFATSNVAWFSRDATGLHSKEERAAAAYGINSKVCSGKITFDKGIELYRAYLGR